MFSDVIWFNNQGKVAIARISGGILTITALALIALVTDPSITIASTDWAYT
jgi:hypothetical protein